MITTILTYLGGTVTSKIVYNENIYKKKRFGKLLLACAMS